MNLVAWVDRRTETVTLIIAAVAELHDGFLFFRASTRALKRYKFHLL